MIVAQSQFKGWGKMVDPPKLTSQQWNLAGLLGVVLIVMAVLQIISFSDFKDWLSQVGIDSPATCAVILIVAELWAALGFFKLKLMLGFRAISALLAVLVSGFWFVENLRLVSEGQAGTLTSSGFFGGFLEQSPGWLTVIESALLLFWVIYTLNLTKNYFSRGQ